MKPIRIQRKRTKGWKMPPNTIYVGRPSKWGNPYKPDRMCFCPKREENVLVAHQGHAVDLYEEFIKDWMQDNPVASDALQELRGKNLACFCALGQPCHADVLLKLANKEDGAA